MRTLLLIVTLVVFGTGDSHAATTSEITERGSGELEVSWVIDTGVTHSGIEVSWISTKSTSQTFQSVRRPKGSTKFLITGLSPDTEYEIVVSSLNSATPPVATQLVSKYSRTLSLGDGRSSQKDFARLESEEDIIDLSHAMISAVKGLSTDENTSEWFSIQLKFGATHKFVGDSSKDTPKRVWDRVWQTVSNPFTLSYFDINLAPSTTIVDLDDGTISEQKQDILNDLTVSVNWQVSQAEEYRPRTVFIGPTYKLFAKESYNGFQIGSIESAQSRFFGSYIAGGLIKAWNSHDWLTYVEFTLRSDHGPKFFQTFAVHGAIIIPEHGEVDPRITLLVPIQSVFGFF